MAGVILLNVPPLSIITSSSFIVVPTARPFSAVTSTAASVHVNSGSDVGVGLGVGLGVGDGGRGFANIVTDASGGATVVIVLPSPSSDDMSENTKAKVSLTP